MKKIIPILFVLLMSACQSLDSSITSEEISTSSVFNTSSFYEEYPPIKANFALRKILHSIGPTFESCFIYFNNDGIVNISWKFADNDVEYFDSCSYHFVKNGYIGYFDADIINFDKNIDFGDLSTKGFWWLYTPGDTELTCQSYGIANPDGYIIATFDLIQ